MRQYICKHYKAEELVDPETYSLYGKCSWQFFNPDALRMIDGIWEYFDQFITPGNTVIVINDWSWGGRFRWSGLRTIFCNEGSDRSIHRIATAFDLKFPRLRDIEPAMTYDDIRQEILKNKNHELLCRINCIEAGTNTWLHADSRNCEERILIV
ncbi:MAG: hypothetical protein JXB42_01750 [Deltaproteobacteria bacterium]|nr:hypothetical protein [Deltaproteobacteria bacterium]